jgi:DNA-binding winged helix-turn-helix (wHTH) protein
MFRLRQRIVDPSLNRVTSNGHTVQVEPKIMQVLVALAERSGEVVTREELMARVWPDVFVTDDVLNRAVRELRRLFDDGTEQPGVIETIRKRGYRLTVPVEPIESPARIGPLQGPPPIAPAAAATPRPTPRVPRAAVVVAMVIAAAAVFLIVRYGMGRPASVDTEARVRFTPYTSDPGNEVDPALSASGRLAYVARGTDGRAHLFTKLSPEARAVQVTDGPARQHAPAWSPDEMQLAFVEVSERG